MAVSPDYLAFVLEQLEALGGVSSGRMFGGVGLRRHGMFFGYIDDDVLYLKTDDLTRPDFQAAGSEAFRPFDSDGTMSYWSAPLDALEDPDLLVEWARKAVDAAERAAAKKKPKKPKST